MPSINLRLSDTELVLLRDWAHDSRRSLQKEIVWRLFSGDVGENLQVAKVGPATGEPREGMSVPADGTVAELAERENAEANPKSPSPVQDDEISGSYGSSPARSASPRMYPCKHHLPPSKKCPYGCDG